LIGTGSELQIALDARDQLQAGGIPARVISMLCLEWFAAQDPAYRDTVPPPSVRARVSVEAGITSGWSDLHATIATELRHTSHPSDRRPSHPA
jgi:transketolase